MRGHTRDSFQAWVQGLVETVNGGLELNAIVMGGKGQVGGAIANILENHGVKCAILDIGFRPKAYPKNAFLHVCIPYSDDFVRVVKSEILRYKPAMTIIHSTVPVGTTRKIGQRTAHSPVRGQHDRLEWSLLKFVKYIGGTTKNYAAMAETHLSSCGLKTVVWGKPEDTELMKMLCLSRYLNDLSFYETAYQICVDYKVSPAFMLQWTTSYNEGYAGTRYTRAALDFPRGKPGGHCVLPVSKMLYKQTKCDFLGKNISVFDGGHE